MNSWLCFVLGCYSVTKYTRTNSTLHLTENLITVTNDLSDAFRRKTTVSGQTSQNKHNNTAGEGKSWCISKKNFFGFSLL